MTKERKTKPAPGAGWPVIFIALLGAGLMAMPAFAAPQGLGAVKEIKTGPLAVEMICESGSSR